MSESMNQDRVFEVLTAAPVRTRRRPRDWSVDEKARLISQTLLPGANVSAIARSAGVDPSQLYGWRRQARASGAVKAMPVAHDEVKFARVEAAGSWAVEIVIRDAVVRVGGDIDPDHLTVILRAVRKA
jgi:transposase